MRARLLLTILLLCGAVSSGFAQQWTNCDFGIYVVEPSSWIPSGDLSRFRLVGKPVISEADILSYDWGTHTMRVTTNAILRLPRFNTETFSNFVVVVRGERCYAGSFWPLDVSTRIIPPNVPIIPVPTDRTRALTRADLSIGINVRHSGAGFVSSPPATADPRSDPRVRDMLQSLGKFKAVPGSNPNNKGYPAAERSRASMDAGG